MGGQRDIGHAGLGGGFGEGWGWLRGRIARLHSGEQHGEQHGIWFPKRHPRRFQCGFAVCAPRARGLDRSSKCGSRQSRLCQHRFHVGNRDGIDSVGHRVRALDRDREFHGGQGLGQRVQRGVCRRRDPDRRPGHDGHLCVRRADETERRNPDGDRGKSVGGRGEGQPSDIVPGDRRPVRDEPRGIKRHGQLGFGGAVFRSLRSRQHCRECGPDLLRSGRGSDRCFAARQCQLESGTQRHPDVRGGKSPGRCGLGRFGANV